MSDEEEKKEGKQSKQVIGFDVGVKNLAFCVVDIPDKNDIGDDTHPQVIMWDVISLANDNEKASKIAISELSQRLFAALDSIANKLEELGYDSVNTVLIENQPSRLNGSMKSMQMMIYSYYQLRRYWEGKVNSVSMVAASQKIADHLHPHLTSKLDEIPKNKKGYALNKWKAIQYGRLYIAEDQVLATYMTKYKKADDAFDALLHVVAWARRAGYDITKITASPKFTSTGAASV